MMARLVVSVCLSTVAILLVWNLSEHWVNFLRLAVR